MARRRPPLRRMRRRPAPGRVLPALRALRQAHRLMDMGQYAQAYPTLKRLADGAVERGMPGRAASLYVQAARARLEMGSAQDALLLARRAVQLFADTGQHERLGRIVPRMVETLEAKGYHIEAVSLKAETAALLGDAGPPLTVQRQGALPAKCPSCGGPVRGDEVDWIDDLSAECVYCGSTIRAEMLG